MVQLATELIDQFVRHLLVHCPVPSTGMQLEDTSVSSAYIFLFQLPRLRILGMGSKGVNLLHKLALYLV
jgi:hypothetical protein